MKKNIIGFFLLPACFISSDICGTESFDIGVSKTSVVTPYGSGSIYESIYFEFCSLNSNETIQYASNIDERKFSTLCQFWINKVEKEYDLRTKFLLEYTLNSSSSVASFQFDKLKLHIFYFIHPNNKGGEVHETKVWFSFDQYSDYEAFVHNKPFAGMKKKKTKIEYYPIIYRIDIENYPAEEQDEFNRIFFGQAGPVSFNVKAAFDSVAQLALREPLTGENTLYVYRDKANRFFSGEGVLQNFEMARDLYQKAWSLGDDTAGLFLGFLYLESGIGEKNKLYNPALAKAYFDSVYLSGNPTGNYGLGWMYQVGFNNDGYSKDVLKAISYYEKGAAKGDICCISSLYFIYTNEYGFQDREKAKLYYEQLAYLNPGFKQIECHPNKLTNSILNNMPNQIYKL